MKFIRERKIVLCDFFRTPAAPRFFYKNRLLFNAAFLQQQDMVRVFDGREPVGDDYEG